MFFILNAIPFQRQTHTHIHIIHTPNNFGFKSCVRAVFVAAQE